MKEWKKGRKVIVKATGEEGRVHAVNYYMTDPGYPAEIDTITVDVQGAKVEYSQNQILTHKQAYEALRMQEMMNAEVRKANENREREYAETQIKLIQAGFVPVSILRQLALDFPTLSWTSEEDESRSLFDTGSEPVRVFHYGTLSLDLRNNGSFGEAYLQAIGEALR